MTDWGRGVAKELQIGSNWQKGLGIPRRLAQTQYRKFWTVRCIRVAALRKKWFSNFPNATPRPLPAISKPIVARSSSCFRAPVIQAMSPQLALAPPGDPGAADRQEGPHGAAAESRAARSEEERHLRRICAPGQNVLLRERAKNVE